ncbi:MAG: hypothetical protein Q9224_001862 [Gallowayella concinna]
MASKHCSVHGTATKMPGTTSVQPIAVIGLAGRFPGEATDARALWNLCCEGRSAWSEIREDRFSGHAYHHSDPAKIGCFNTKGAHFITQDLATFDTAFFGISPYEAKTMDPQQKIFLETTFEALENAGITREEIAGQNTGVYVGCSNVDYSAIATLDTQNIPVYMSTGMTSNMLSNRISYTFDLKGPSLTMDTACSSSLAAMHMACQSLRLGEINQAIVGGVYLMLSADPMIGLNEGRSYSYDSRATGYGRGEGVVSLILKPLDTAIRDGDNIRALIRNTGINQDGKTAGITYPSCDAQAGLISSVYAAAGLDPRETDYVEAHGTGTAAGDPVEAEAIARIFTKDRAHDDPLFVGSVKSNIGHLEGASGLAAMVKTIIALEEGVIPPNFDFREPNKDIPMDKWKIRIPTTTQPWPHPELRRASISNYGYGGTNTHVILESYKPAREVAKPYVNGHGLLDISSTEPYTNGHHPQDSDAAEHSTKKSASRQRRMFLFSANDKQSLRARISHMVTYLDKHQDLDPKVLSFTLAQKMSLLDWRAAACATTISELREILTNAELQLQKAGSPKVGFIFTGQGAQWATMGLGLLRYPLFAGTLHEADRVLRDIGAQWSLLDELHKDSEFTRVAQPLLSQPTTTAIQIALVNLLSSWNINPSAVVGHSSGEIAAAYAAGALSLSDCMHVAYHRGVLAESLKDLRPDRPGAMLAIGASPDKVRPMLKRLGSANAIIACINSPSSVTASGDERAITRLQALAAGENLLNRRLKVEVAYHSSHMEDIARQYLEAISSVVPQSQSKVTFHSSVKGELVNTSSLTAAYWVENMTSPVQFSDGVQNMYHKCNGLDTLIEIGPHSTLEAPLKDIMKSLSSSVRYYPTLVRNKDATTTAMSMAAALHVLGFNVDVSAINQVDLTLPLASLSDLPAYPWNHSKRYWKESRLSVNHRQKRFPRNDLLGNLVDDFNVQEPRWRNILRLSEVPWLVDHNVQGSTILPFTCYLAMAIEAISQYATLNSLPVNDATLYNFREVQVNRSIILTEEDPTEISFVLRPRDEGTRSSARSWLAFTVYSWTPDNGWSEHCQGLVKLTQEDEGLNAINGARNYRLRKEKHNGLVSRYQSICQEVLDPADIYDRFNKGGLHFGPAFRNITAARWTLDHAIGTVTVPDTARDMPSSEESTFRLHPRTLDSCYQVTDTSYDDKHRASLDIHVPVFLTEITIKHRMRHHPGQELHVYSKKHRPFVDNDAESHASFVVVSADDPSDVLVEAEDVVGTRLPTTVINSTAERDLCYSMQWAACTELLSQEQFRAAFASPGIDPLPQLEKLERGAFYYMQRLLDELTAENTPPQFRRLYASMASLYAKAQDAGLPFQMAEWLQSNEEEQEKFLEDLVGMDDCGQLLGAIGGNLLPIMEETIEPMSIMQHRDKLGKYYRSLDILRGGNDIAAAVVSNLAFQNPGMRILEIGGGSANATTTILEALGSRFAIYHFTDGSPKYLDNAKEACNEWGDKMKYTVLDIEKDPFEQNPELGLYDLVFASNTLHNTANMTKTMKSIRSLLRLGGKILFSEPTATLLSNIVIFGSLPDWSRSEEPERQDGSYLTESQWDSVLKTSGFSGIDASAQVSPGGTDTSSVVLSTACSEQTPVYPQTAILTCRGVEPGLMKAISDQVASITGQPQIITGHLTDVELDDQYGIVLALDTPFWSDMTEDDLKTMQKMIASARGLLWVTRGAQAANPAMNMVNGFARTIRIENAGLRFVTLDLDEQQVKREAQMIDTIIKVFKHTFVQDNEAKFFDDLEFTEMDGVLQISRALLDRKKDQFIMRETYEPAAEPQQFHQPGRPLTLAVGQIGLLDSIHYVDDEEVLAPLKRNEVEISIATVGMNFIDIMMSLGQIPLSRRLGQECSGTISAIGQDVHDLAVGDRVCAMATGSYGNFVRTSQYWAVKIPPDMDFNDAASIPIIFCTAHYALTDVARLSKGESVLIHAAAGGVGQAAIMLAKIAGAEIYVTVGSSDKKRLMLEEYSIPEDRIFSSRDTSFKKELMAMTGDRGVDVVLNSTSGDILQQSWQCLAPLGRFVEIGKRDFVQNSNLEMNQFLQSVTFAGVDLGVFGQNRPLAFHRVLSEMVDLHSRKVLESIKPLNVFPISEMQKAMRMMQSGKHIGKIIINCTGDQVVQALPAPSPKMINHTDASYLITGGTGGIGRSITRRLAKEGAKNIILASRSGLDQKGIPELIDELQALGVTVFVDRCDVADPTQVQALVDKSQESRPPIRGVIHGAMALRDALFENITYSDWQTNIKPRMQGALNLHNALLNNNLDFFIMLSSISGIAGNPGQSAYAASNAFLDSFASYRTRLGLPASTINIGVVAEVGYAAEKMEITPAIAAAAQDHLSEAELLAVVKASIIRPVEGCDYGQTITGLRLEPGKTVPLWCSDPKFAHILAAHAAITGGASDSSSPAHTVRQVLKQATTLASAIRIVAEAVAQRLASLLMISVDDINISKPLVAYGLDSLAAVELRNWMTSGLEANVPLIELMNSPSIEHLAGKIVRKSRIVEKGLLEAEEEGEGAVVEEGKEGEKEKES